jgi:hypothetical protein
MVKAGTQQMATKDTGIKKLHNMASTDRLIDAMAIKSPKPESGTAVSQSQTSNPLGTTHMTSLTSSSAIQTDPD